MKNKQYEKQGERLKKEYDFQKKMRAEKGEKYSVPVVAEMLSLSSGNRSALSPFFSGDRLLSEDRYKLLASAWGVRIEYLKCEDDFRTEDDMFKAAATAQNESIDLHLDYLESLGYQFVPHLFLRVGGKALVDHWKEIAPTFTDNARDVIFGENHGKLLKMMYVPDDGTEPTPVEIDGVKHNSIWATPELLEKLALDEISYYDKNYYIPVKSEIPLSDEMNYEMFYSVSIKDKEIATVSIGDLVNIFNIIDEYTEKTFSLWINEVPHYISSRHSLRFHLNGPTLSQNLSQNQTESIKLIRTQKRPTNQ